MAVLLSQFLLLTLVTCIKADGCFERFGSDEAECKTAHGECEWLELDGQGKCMMSSQKDACFERFGSNKANCTDTNGLCLWVEKDGEGKCVMPRHSKGHHGNHTDGCFERFGSNKDNCSATDGLCMWVEKDGEGKCLMPRHSKGHHSNHTDGCFERFGSNKANCTASKGHCIWMEQDGKGKCVHKEGAGSKDKPRGGNGVGKGPEHNTSGKDADRNHKEGSTKARQEGAHQNGKEGPKESHGEDEDRISKDGAQKTQQKGPERARNEEGRKVMQKIAGVFSISIGSALASPEVLENLKQQSELLEHALAHSHGYHKVTILGLDVARRLRAAINTQVRIRFEAEVTTGLLYQASGSDVQLQRVLQESFVKAGFDFEVQSATVAISSTEPINTGDEHNSARFLMVAAIAAGLILCTCGPLLFICLRRRSRAAAKAAAAQSDVCLAPVYGVPCKDNEKCDADIDLCSVSTGTPSTNDNLSEGCL